jgi:hypothetical protein
VDGFLGYCIAKHHVGERLLLGSKVSNLDSSKHIFCYIVASIGVSFTTIVSDHAIKLMYHLLNHRFAVITVCPGSRVVDLHAAGAVPILSSEVETPDPVVALQKPGLPRREKHRM